MPPPASPCLFTVALLAILALLVLLALLILLALLALLVLLVFGATKSTILSVAKKNVKIYSGLYGIPRAEQFSP